MTKFYGNGLLRSNNFWVVFCKEKGRQYNVALKNNGVFRNNKV